MDQEQLAAGGAAIRGQSNKTAVESSPLDESSGEYNDFVREAAAGTPADASARSEVLGIGATTASVAAAPARVGVRQHEQAGQALSRPLFEGCSGNDEDGRAKDLREFDSYIKMQLQQQPQTQGRTQHQKHPSPSSMEGSEVAPAPASSHLDLELRL